METPKVRLAVVETATWAVTSVAQTPYIKLKVRLNRPVYITKRRLVKVFIAYPLLIPLGPFTKEPIPSLEEVVGRIKVPTNKDGYILIEKGKTIPELIGKAVAITVVSREYKGAVYPYAQLVKNDRKGIERIQGSVLEDLQKVTEVGSYDSTKKLSDLLRSNKITYYHSNACPKHHCKLAETVMGEKWCPKCEGERMAKEVHFLHYV